jgi:protein TonB
MLRRNLLHNMALMKPRLIPALALSIALHIGIFLPDFVNSLALAGKAPALLATLRLPPKPEVPTESLLKNTIDAEQMPQVAVPPHIMPTPARVNAKSEARRATREIERTQRKLSKQLFYPPEAVERGIEGDVWLILKYSADGEIIDVGIATSSGHPILDNAAVKAAYAMPKDAGAASREEIVRAHFHLEP